MITHEPLDKPDALPWPVYWYHVKITRCITMLQSRPYGNTHHTLDTLLTRLPQNLTPP